MPFGYIPPDRPGKSWLKNTAYRWASCLLGYPNYLRRLQAGPIFRAMQTEFAHIVLDIGCGQGHYTYELAAQCRLAVGIDLDVFEENLQLVQYQPSTLACVKGDVLSLPLASGSVDRILISSVIQMLEQDLRLVQEAVRALKSSGVLVLTVPETYPLISWLYVQKDSNHWTASLVGKLLSWFKMPATYPTLLLELNRRFGVDGKGYYSREEISKLLEDAGLETVSIEYTPGIAGSFLYELILLGTWFLKKSRPHKSWFVLYPLAVVGDAVLGNASGCELLILSRVSS